MAMKLLLRSSALSGHFPIVRQLDQCSIGCRCRALEIVWAADFGATASLHISAIFGQPRNVMFSVFYDIIAEAIAAQRFPALAVLALARKCHEMCGYVTFYEIFGVNFMSWS
jgi:hypothetical protein